MTPEQKQEHWVAHIEGWQQSGLTQPDYCKQKNISYAQFGYWRTRLNREVTPDRKLIPATLIQPSALASLYLPAGIRLDVPSHTLADILPVIYRTVQASPK